MQRMAERARRLEAQNVGDKEWFMRGEADSGLRQRSCTCPQSRQSPLTGASRVQFRSGTGKATLTSSWISSMPTCGSQGD